MVLSRGDYQQWGVHRLKQSLDDLLVIVSDNSSGVSMFIGRNIILHFQLFYLHFVESEDDNATKNLATV